MTQKRLMRWIGGTAVMLLLMAGLLWVDPFGWRVFDRLKGEIDIAISAMPPETAVYISIDLLQFQSPAWQQLFAPFVQAVGEEGDISAQDALQTQIENQFNISYNEDVRPWLGASFGVALLNVETDFAGELTAVQWVMAVETRSKQDSDAFLQKLSVGWAETTGITAVTHTYQDVDLTHFAAEASSDQLAFGRVDNLVLVGSDLDAVQKAIDAYNDVSLANTSGYTTLQPTLVDGRLAAVYFNMPRLSRYQDAFPLRIGAFSLPRLPTDGVLGTAVSISQHPSGFQLDATTAYNLSQLSGPQQLLVQTQVADTRTAASLSLDTILYLNGVGVNHLWGVYRTAFIDAASEADFADSMGLLNQQFGLNPESDLLPFLDGETAVAVVPGTGGVLPQLAEVGVDLILTVAISDEQGLSTNITTFSDAFNKTLGTVSHSSNANGITEYQLETVLLPDFSLHYGVGQSKFLLATSVGGLQAAQVDMAVSLANTPRFQAAWAQFPAQMTPGLYLDVQRWLSHSQNMDIANTSLLKPIDTITGAGQRENDQTHYRIIVSILNG
jgi:hypothetical protein